MEVMVKKFQSKFRKVKEEMNRWDELQSCLISQFRNASHILDRLQVLQMSNNYGTLNCVSGVRDALLEKQIGSLNNILVSMRKTLEEFHCIVASLEKLHCDGRQLVKGSSSRTTMKQLQQRVGVKPRLIDCLDGLLFLHEIYYSEYLLKSSVVSVLSAMAIMPRLPLPISDTQITQRDSSNIAFHVWFLLFLFY
ncbi:PPR superfamily protein [Medicago truncatula]|uniref:PPR superfamily protein n=1 Tax=Medicago truncatula TaxID=3880 RepID=A0A072VQY8_MEDTR|nr:PPR superfamily protein [Medicago truncatula]